MIMPSTLITNLPATLLFIISSVLVAFFRKESKSVFIYAFLTVVVFVQCKPLHYTIALVEMVTLGYIAYSTSQKTITRAKEWFGVSITLFLALVFCIVSRDGDSRLYFLKNMILLAYLLTKSVMIAEETREGRDLTSFTIAYVVLPVTILIASGPSSLVSIKITERLIVELTLSFVSLYLILKLLYATAWNSFIQRVAALQVIIIIGLYFLVGESDSLNRFSLAGLMSLFIMIAGYLVSRFTPGSTWLEKVIITGAIGGSIFSPLFINEVHSLLVQFKIAPVFSVVIISIIFIQIILGSLAIKEIVRAKDIQDIGIIFSLKAKIFILMLLFVIIGWCLIL